MVTIVDSGIGNVGSIVNMLKRCAVPVSVSSDPAAVAGASKLILPGVGAFDAGMESLRAQGLDQALREAVLGKGVPVLGVCLGLQLMAQGSEEGEAPGLGWLAARVVRFRLGEAGAKLPLPHMGWSPVAFKPGSRLGPTAGSPRYYFVHSYHLECENEDEVTGKAVYGHEFAVVVEKDNILGVQFHPEKSHRYGLELLRRFAAV